MEKDFNQINVSRDTVRQLNEGLYLIQNDLDSLKMQVLQSKLLKKTDQAFTCNADIIERQNSRELDNISNRNETILFKLFDQLVALSNDVKDLKRNSSQPLTTEEIAKIVHSEMAECFETKFAEVKNTMTDVKAELDSFRGTQSLSVENVEKKLNNQTKTDQTIENLAVGVEQKLELKFSEMFLELNRVIEEIKVQKIERRNEIDENKLFSIELIDKITNRLNALTQKIDSIESLNETNTQSILEAKDRTITFDNQPIFDRFDKLAEYVSELVGTAKTDNNKNGIVSNEEKTQICEKLNAISELINSKKVEDFKPIYEVLNELDQKLADIKFGISDVANKPQTVSNGVNAVKEDSDKVIKALNETIPRIIRESIANSLVNVDDSGNKGSFEKLANQINLIFANEEQKFDEVFKKIDGIKNEIGLGVGMNAETSDEFRPNEIEETLSSLRNELMSLSKLISDAEVDDETVENSESSIPKAISDATKTLDDLTKEIL